MTRRNSLEHIRSLSYKERDAWWTVFLVDPLAVRLVWLISPYSWITPNLITIIAFIVGLGSAVSFFEGTRTALVVGAALFYLSFLLDCMDGKIARLNDNGSTFGPWLDYVFDRLRVTACAVALMGGQYRITGELTYIWLGGIVIFLDMFRYLNHLQIQQVWQTMRSQVAPGITDPKQLPASVLPDLGRFVQMRNRLSMSRVRLHLFSGIEFQMFVFIVGPLIGQVVIATTVSAVLLAGFECLIIWTLYRAAKKFDQTKTT